VSISSHRLFVRASLQTPWNRGANGFELGGPDAQATSYNATDAIK
jgi:hypothetical protein